MNMRKAAKHVQKNPNKMRQHLLLALNGDVRMKDGSSPMGVPRVLRRARRLARIVLGLQRLVVDTPKVVDVRDHLRVPAARHLFQLNEQLAAYTSFPYIGTDKRGEWGFGWHVKGRAYGDQDGEESLQLSADFPLVLTAVNLAEQGLIDRVRRCPIDRRWFYARTRETRFCCAKCREKFHQRDPARKEKRAAYMRENYQTHRTKNVK